MCRLIAYCWAGLKSPISLLIMRLFSHIRGALAQIERVPRIFSNALQRLCWQGHQPAHYQDDRHDL